ncbi:MAG: hypothetical protein WDM89_06535 [Rhizomicrobium sp.]
MSEVVPFPARGVAPQPRLSFEAESLSSDKEWDVCPWSDSVTDYDKRNIGLFYRLMHDESEGAREVDIARDVFGMSFWLHSQRTRLVVRSHMRRAHWLAENVFPLLGW